MNLQETLSFAIEYLETEIDLVSDNLETDDDYKEVDKLQELHDHLRQLQKREWWTTDSIQAAIETSRIIRDRLEQKRERAAHDYPRDIQSPTLDFVSKALSCAKSLDRHAKDMVSFYEGKDKRP